MGWTLSHTSCGLSCFIAQIAFSLTTFGHRLSIHPAVIHHQQTISNGACRGECHGGVLKLAVYACRCICNLYVPRLHAVAYTCHCECNLHVLACPCRICACRCICNLLFVSFCMARVCIWQFAVPAPHGWVGDAFRRCFKPRSRMTFATRPYTAPSKHATIPCCAIGIDRMLSRSRVRGAESGM